MGKTHPEGRCSGCEHVPDWQYVGNDEDGFWWHSCIRPGDVKAERAVRRMMGETDLEPCFRAECECTVADGLTETDAAEMQGQTCETCGEPWTVTRFA